MNKPITVQIRETKEALIKVLNDSKMHVAILKPILDELKAEVDRQYAMTEEHETKEYKKAQQGVKQEVKENHEVEQDIVMEEGE